MATTQEDIINLIISMNYTQINRIDFGKGGGSALNNGSPAITGYNTGTGSNPLSGGGNGGANTGGGGGGGGSEEGHYNTLTSPGGSGGSGIVVVAILTSSIKS
jgi:hypothetical protein